MFRPIKTKKITDNLFAIRTLFVNLYIYDTGNNLIVFDTGVSKQLVKLGFRQLKLNLEKVSHVFLTHSDFDHTNGLNLFKNNEVFISKKEEPLITRKKARRGIIYNKRITGQFLEDSQELKIDNTTIKLLETPGHTLGSAIFIINNAIAITGDTISLTRDGKVKNFSFVQNMNHRLNINTVNKLKEKDFFKGISIIATGHHGIYLK